MRGNSKLKAAEMEDDRSTNMKSERQNPDEQKEKTRRLDELDKISFHPYDIEATTSLSRLRQNVVRK